MAKVLWKVSVSCVSNGLPTFFVILPFYLSIPFLRPFPVLPVLDMDSKAFYMLGSFLATEIPAYPFHFLLKENKDLETLQNFAHFTKLASRRDNIRTQGCQYLDAEFLSLHISGSPSQAGSTIFSHAEPNDVSWLCIPLSCHQHGATHTGLLHYRPQDLPVILFAAHACIVFLVHGKI